MKNLNYLVLIPALILFSCNNKSNNKSKSKDKFEVSMHEGDGINDTESSKDEEIVFYNMFTPIDLDKIINKNNSFFNSVNINTLNNLTKYETTSKIALNLGVYGADLSYLWVFDQNQQALSYLSAIQHLTDKLGIPRDFVDYTISSAETSSEQIDTLKSIAKDAYKATDRYLKGSDRENSAILILLAGWVETLYISLNIYKEENPKLASKIITQKYSLNSLITMLQNHQDELEMSEYLLLLKKLNNLFTKFENKLKPGDIIIDTSKKKIAIKENVSLEIKPEEFTELKEQVNKIRNHIID